MNTRAAKMSVCPVASLLLMQLSIPVFAASRASFNPDDLEASKFSQVSTACQNVLGLSPSERLTGGYWLGSSRLDYWTNHYRGCITSLSDSVQSAMADSAAQQADVSCRAKGLVPGSALALCVLSVSEGASAQMHITVDSGSSGSVSTSLNLISPAASGGPRVQATATLPGVKAVSARTTSKQEALACASVGIDPADPAFHACVLGLEHTFHALDTPIT